MPIRVPQKGTAPTTYFFPRCAINAASAASVAARRSCCSANERRSASTTSAGARSTKLALASFFSLPRSRPAAVRALSRCARSRPRRRSSPARSTNSSPDRSTVLALVGGRRDARPPGRRLGLGHRFEIRRHRLAAAPPVAASQRSEKRISVLAAACSAGCESRASPPALPGTARSGLRSRRLAARDRPSGQAAIITLSAGRSLVVEPALGRRLRSAAARPLR